MIEIPQSYNGKPLIHAWDYCAKDGAPFGVVGRYQDKTGKQDIVPFFKRNGASWTAGIDLNPRPLYGLNMLAAHPKEKAVLIVRGEKSAAALQSLGVTTLTSLGGSQAAKQADWIPLNGYKMVYLMLDNDEPGEHYMKDVYGALAALETPPQVKVLRLSGLPDKGDIVDWLQNHAPDWDGLQSFPATDKAWALSELRAELKKAESVPENWTLAGLAGSCSSVFDWEEPGTIEQPLSAVPALPIEIIPEPFREWLKDISHRMQTPTDFATITALVVSGSVIGAGCGIRPKQKDNWEVIPNIWGACIGRPSVVLKSPSMKEPMGMLERLQAEAGKAFDKEKNSYEFDTLASKAKLDELKGRLAKAAKGTGKDGVTNGDDESKLKADYLELTENEASEPTRRLFKTNETSVQSQTVLQVQNPRGILTFRDELTGLLVRWDREEAQDERAYFLEGWNGNGSYTDFKIGRGLTEAPNICISLLGGIQPDKLRRYMMQTMNGGNDGLMQRLQLAVWPDEPKNWRNVDIYPNTEEKNRVYAIIAALANMDFLQFGAVKGDYDDRPYFRFSDDAQVIFNDWLARLQLEKLVNEDNPYMAEHLGKYRSLMPSLALIFHCIDIADGNGSGQISVKAARLAVDWCKYLESHARRIYGMCMAPEREAAAILSEHIKKGDLPSPFTSKAVYDKGWHGLKDKQEVDAACNILIDESWLLMQRKPKPITGRPPLPEYLINPIFL